MASIACDMNMRKRGHPETISFDSAHLHKKYKVAPPPPPANFPENTSPELPGDTSGWAHLFVSELSKCTTIEAATSQASNLLTLFQSSITTPPPPLSPPESSERLFEENRVLKRAVVIQNEKLEGKCKELEQCGEEIKRLKHLNYGLGVRLNIALDHKPMPGSFHPDFL